MYSSKSPSHWIINCGLMAVFCLNVVSNFVSGQEANKVPEILKLAPESCQFLGAWHPAAGVVAEANHTQQLLAEPEVKEFLQQLRTAAGNMVRMAMAEQPIANQKLGQDILVRLLDSMENQSGLLFIEKYDLDGEGGAASIEGGMAIEIRKDGRFMASLSRLLLVGGIKVRYVQIAGMPFLNIKAEGLPNQSDVLVGMADNYLIAGLGKECVEGIIGRIKNTEPVGWVSDIYAASKVPNPTSIGYFNVASLLKKMEPLIGPQGQGMVKSLGLDAIGSIDSVSGYDQAGLMTKMSLSVTGEPKGLLSLLDSQPINPGQLNRIPSDSIFATSMAVDTKKILNLIRSLTDEFDPRSAEMMDSFFAEFRQHLMLDLEKDLIGLMGPTMTFFNGVGDGLITGMVLSVELQDPKKFRLAHALLIGSLQERFEGKGDGISTTQVGDQTVYTFGGMIEGFPLPIEPSWSVVDDRLLFSLFPGALTPYVSRHPRDTYLSTEDLLVTDSDNNNVLAFAFVDDKQQFGMMYSYAQMIKSMGAMMEQNFGPADEMTSIAALMSGIRLPSARSIYRHLQPSRAVVRRTKTGLDFVAHQTLPTPNLLAATPVGVALLLPAVSSARTAARRTSSANNLKMQALALHNYHDVFKAFPPAYSTDEDGKPLLSWRVHVLPFIEENALYEQFHLDEPWDSEHNIKLVAQMPSVYRSPQSNARPGMTTYRGIGGKGAAFIAPRVDGRDSKVKGSRMRDFLDGTSNSVLIVEATDKMAVPWSKPNVLDVKQINAMTIGPIFGFYRGGTNFAMADGSVMFFPDSVTADVLLKFFTIADGEVVDWPFD